uniref:Uncharacterized protein n=1 Tax=Rhizophora mucronata TaxID=61149 RepID=A0A2P2QCJ1_RHIMU
MPDMPKPNNNINTFLVTLWLRPWAVKVVN